MLKKNGRKRKHWYLKRGRKKKKEEGNERWQWEKGQKCTSVKENCWRKKLEKKIEKKKKLTREE